MSSVRTPRYFLFFACLSLLMTACSKDNPAPASPTMENLELGLSNRGFAIAGRDFHFEADIIAGERIGDIEVKIMQKAGNTYARPWTHTVVWDQYKGARNANIHKHFDIPADAPEGTYSLVVTVHDVNGSQLEVNKDLIIYSPTNLPVDPKLTEFTIQKNDLLIYDVKKGNTNPVERLMKGDIIKVHVTLSGLTGDGKLLMLLVSKSTNHHPETIEQVDLSRSIVYDVYEHTALAAAEFSNYVFDRQTFKLLRDIPALRIGAAVDNNPSTPGSISGLKAWTSGDYDLLVMYKNATANISYTTSVTLGIDYR